MTPADIACYRANYDVKIWRRMARIDGDYCVPLGAALAVAALCDEVERLQRQLKKRRKGK